MSTLTTWVSHDEPLPALLAQQLTGCRAQDTTHWYTDARVQWYFNAWVQWYFDACVQWYFDARAVQWYFDTSVHCACVQWYFDTWAQWYFDAWNILKHGYSGSLIFVFWKQSVLFFCFFLLLLLLLLFFFFFNFVCALHNSFITDKTTTTPTKTKPTNKSKQTKQKQKYNNNLIKRTLNSPTNNNICRQSGCKGNNYTSLINIVCKNYKVASPRLSSLRAGQTNSLERQW